MRRNTSRVCSCRSGTRANFAAGSLVSLRWRERSRAFERDARVGEGAAVSRPVQKAEWSDDAGKLIEGTPTGEPSLAGLRGVALSRGSEIGKSWRRGSVWCHKCQIHLLPPCWARCYIPLGYGTGTSHEKNFKPVLTPIPRGSGGRVSPCSGKKRSVRNKISVRTVALILETPHLVSGSDAQTLNKRRLPNCVAVFAVCFKMRFHFGN